MSMCVSVWPDVCVCVCVKGGGALMSGTGCLSSKNTIAIPSPTCRDTTSYRDKFHAIASKLHEDDSHQIGFDHMDVDQWPYKGKNDSLREKESERETNRQIERERERESACMYVSVCLSLSLSFSLSLSLSLSLSPVVMARRRRRD